MTPTTDEMSSAEKPVRSHEGRKSSKPLMEKRRRARINDCLTELQTILDTLNPESNTTRQNKREKADILEQTVKLVKQLRQHGLRGNHPPDPNSQVQFRAGFNECMATVTQFLSANQGSLNGEAKAGLMSHLANSLQCNKVYTERLPHPPRRRPEEAANSVSVSAKLPPTSSQSQAGESSGASSMNVVHPMPAAAPATAVTSSSPHSTVSVPVSVPSAMNGALPGVTARLEFTPNRGNNVQNATRLVPIHIPIKVQSPGQIILVPCQSHMLNGNQLTTPIIPVMSPPNANLASSPLSSAGSSGSVAISPAIHHQSPQKSPPQPLEVAGPSTAGTIMYASCPASAATPNAAQAGGANLIHQAAPYPVAFVAMGDPSEMQNEQFYQNLPRFFVPANPPNGSDPVWRPW
ncbi:transcription factor HES-1-A-like [Lytechinus pictus]|uniref:transcription factor HES-1-A-like n=1 Tax=Lytechinus pictus TaxID=7653 RepID=UPI0030BA0014